ncbi:MAG: glycosyltransferase family 39 protein [Chloroflexi bacterium]|nr:glycosyltransferase family 39 protein [Chloroflexota bacterium]
MHAEINARERDSLFPALTVEVALYVALVGASLCWRLFALGDAPLASDEARQALAAWNFLRGVPDAYVGSSLLYVGSSLPFTGDFVLFALFGASDSVARVLPALFGSALVLAPLFFRRELGQVGAVIASVLLVFSPSLLFFARTADAAILALTCALYAVVCARIYFEHANVRALNLAALFAALALLAGSELWIFIFAISIVLFAKLQRGEKFDLTEKYADLARAGLLFLVTFVGAGTILFLRRDGLGAAIDALGNWFRLGNPANILGMLALYEPLILLGGVAGIAQTIRVARASENYFQVSLAGAIVLTFLLNSFGLFRQSAQIVNLIAPLIFFAARWIGDWVMRIMNALSEWEEERATLTAQAALFLLASVLIIFVYFVLAEFTARGNVVAFDFFTRGVEGGNSTGLLIVLLAFGAMGAVALMAIASVGVWRAQNIATALIIFWLSVWSVRQSAMLNFLPRNVNELYVDRAASSNVRDLMRDVADISRWRANDTRTLNLNVDESLGAIAAWNLRDQVNAKIIAHPALDPQTQAELLSINAPAPAPAWIFQRYQLEILRGAPPTNFLRWLIFRDGGVASYTSAVLWAPSP